MIDVVSLLMGLALGVGLTISALLLRLRSFRSPPKAPPESKFLTLAEVRETIESQSTKEIKAWGEQKTETERLTGKGVA